MAPAETARRVDVIVGRMQAHEWNDATAAELAQFWKVQPATIEKLASEASRRVAFILGLVADPEKLKADVSGMLVRSLELAHAKGSSADVARIADIVTKITGARVAEKSEVTITAKELESLPPVALLARIRDQRSRLDEAERTLLEEHPELVPVEVYDCSCGESFRGPGAGVVAWGELHTMCRPGPRRSQ